MANIAEGFARTSNREFVRFLDFARASAMEVQALLHLALSEDYITQAEFENLYDKCDHLRRGITSLMGYLKTATTK